MKKVLLCLCLFSIWIFADSAQAAIFIEQGKIEHNVVPGSKTTGSVTVHNTGNEPENVKVYWQDFEYVEPFNGTKDFLPPGSSKLSMAAWIQFTPQEINLAPFGQVNISYVISVPEDFKGGRYGVMFFEPVGPQVDVKTGLNIVSRVGSLFFLHSSNKSKTVDISDIKAIENGIEVEFHNRGNIILIPQATYYVIDDEGKPVDRGDVPKIYVPPSVKAGYKFNFNNEFTPGKYTIVLTIDLQEQDVIVKEIDIEKTPGGDSRIKILGSRD